MPVIKAVNKDKKNKRHGFNGSPVFPFTASETKCDISNKLIYTGCLRNCM